MKHSLDAKQKALYRAIGEILHYVWDPIGIAGVPQARDEYDSYVAQVKAQLEFLAATGNPRAADAMQH